MNPLSLNEHLKNFFTVYLTEQRGLSRNTIASYRDTFKLLLNYIEAKKGIKYPRELTAAEIDVKMILSFLSNLEDSQVGRSNKPQTRNLRLAAIHCFYKYLAWQGAAYSKYARKILAIPMKKVPMSTIDYFNKEELELLFSQIDVTTKDGFRDLVILTLLYDTGARSQEMANMRISWLDLNNRTIKIHGKGNKERVLPLWECMVQVVKRYIDKYRRTPKDGLGDYLFVSQRGKPLTRFGVRSIVCKYIRLAAVKNKDIGKKRLSTHSIRHTTATHLIESGVELNVVKSWLGHASVKTTSRYLDSDFNRKKEILDKFGPPSYVVSITEDKKETGQDDIFEWLKKL